MKWLVLGGTADARKLVEVAYRSQAQPPFDLIYSIAGRVRQTVLPCPVISGGFRQYGGLDAYVKANRIEGILDCTHPFAANMSCTAVAVARDLGIPCWRLARERWQADEGDNWHYFADAEAMLPALQAYQHVFLTIGQVNEAFLQALTTKHPGQLAKQIMMRTAVAVSTNVPLLGVQWIQDIGPFSFTEEVALLTDHRIQVLVTKDSGGDATRAKLDAARACGIPVFLIERPELPAADRVFTCIADCLTALMTYR